MKFIIGSSGKKIMYKYKGFRFKNQEDIIHYEVVQYLKRNYPKVPFLSNHLQGLSIPTKNFNLLKIKKALNGWRGFPDIIIFFSTQYFSSLGLELKTKKGKLSEEQNLLQEALAKSKMCVITIGQGIEINDAIAKAKKIIDSYITNGEIDDGIFKK